MLVKRWFEKTCVGNKELEIKASILKWDKLNKSNGKHSKFQHFWVGMFQISENIFQGTYRLNNL